MSSSSISALKRIAAPSRQFHSRILANPNPTCLRCASAFYTHRAFIIPRADVCIPFLRIGAGVYAFLTAPPSDSAAPMGGVYHLCRRS
ncbi:hypothetical protein C8R44DRAFT_882379 [Mycena epipterygia]|nr:hypothetical protein C8R44DRAFT_882379 [Mycena epipterygia]